MDASNATAISRSTARCFRRSSIFFTLVFPLLPLFGTTAVNFTDSLEQDTARAYSILNTLFEEPVEKITLITDLKKLKREKEHENYQEAQLKIYGPDGLLTEEAMLVKTRGEFRKNYCFFPPLELNFGENPAYPPLDYPFRLKLVTHCKDQIQIESSVGREYLVYQIYNIVSDVSLQTRLVQITYEDIDAILKPETHLAFYIEDKDRLAERMNAVSFKRTNMHQEIIDQFNLNKMVLFQYMIGNTDWSVSMMHNVKLLKAEDVTLPYAVPYDFDYCGLVNAPYAVPPEHLPIHSVRERLYRGFCKDLDKLMPAIRDLASKEEAIISLYQEADFIDNHYRKSSIKYLQEFFRSLENERAIQKEFMRNCRKLE